MQAFANQNRITSSFSYLNLKVISFHFNLKFEVLISKQEFIWRIKADIDLNLKIIMAIHLIHFNFNSDFKNII